MPTIPTRHFRRVKGGTDADDARVANILGLEATSPKTPLRTEVREMELTWSAGMQCCPAPPCKYSFWWSSPPKPMGKKTSKSPK